MGLLLFVSWSAVRYCDSRFQLFQDTIPPPPGMNLKALWFHLYYTSWRQKSGESKRLELGEDSDGLGQQRTVIFWYLQFIEQFRCTAKLSGAHRDFPYPPALTHGEPPSLAVFLREWWVCYSFMDLYLFIPRSHTVYSGCTLFGFGQMCNNMFLSLYTLRWGQECI